ncbi:MAG: Hsp70 family protein [Acidimicrobiia bacterium]
MSYVLGIDIGSTTIAAATGHRGDPVPAVLGRDSHTAPAAVMPYGYESPLVGDDAADQLPIESPQLIRQQGPGPDLGAPARMLGTPGYDAAEALAAAIGWVVDGVASVQGYLPTRLALTHPFTTSTHQPDTLRRVASERMADAMLVPEPIAAAARLNHEAPLAPGTLVAVCDLGGTTFSATLVHRTPQGFDVIGEPGVIADFGGVDIDAALVAHVDAVSEGAVSAIDRHDPAGQDAHRRLWLACRAAKHELALRDETILEVDLPHGPVHLPVSRAQLAELIHGRLAEAAEVVAATVHGAGVRTDDVQVALLVGGASRLSIVGDLINQRTGLPTVAEALPDLTVATGAAALADTDPERFATPGAAAGVAAGAPGDDEGWPTIDPDATVVDGEMEGPDVPAPVLAGLRQRIGDRWLLAGVIATALAVLVTAGVLLASSRGDDGGTEAGPRRSGSSTSSSTATSTTAGDVGPEDLLGGLEPGAEGSAASGLFGELGLSGDASELEGMFGGLDFGGGSLGFGGSGGGSFSFGSGTTTPGTDPPPQTTTTVKKTTTTTRPTTTSTTSSTTTTSSSSTTSSTTTTTDSEQGGGNEGGPGGQSGP